jgi:hypothetical protein
MFFTFGSHRQLRYQVNSDSAIFLPNVAVSHLTGNASDVFTANHRHISIIAARFFVLRQFLAVDCRSYGKKIERPLASG